MAKPDAVRQRACDVLLRVAEGAFCDLLVGEALARGELDERDAALFTRLVYGTVTWQGRLDWTIAGLARRPLERIDLPVLCALRLGLFQLFFLDRIPPHAAVHASVELAKRAGGEAAGRFANAILRAALRQGGERPLPDERADPVQALALRWSHPQWLVRRWLDELGAERAASLLEANDLPAPTVLRVDLRAHSRTAAIAELAALGVAAQATRYARAGIELTQAAGRALAVAWAVPQGEASQLVAELIAPAEGGRLADLCAAPGGKAAAIAEELPAGRGAIVVAADRSPGGMRRVAELARPSGARPLVALRADATLPPFSPEAFDGVLLDAPCSGLGTLRAHPEIRWRRTAESVSALARRQRALLASAARLVRPGGRLIYATCTLLAEENEDVVTDFLAHAPGWRRDDPRPFLPPAAHAFVGADEALRTAPDRGGLDGFYAVRLVRRGP